MCAFITWLPHTCTCIFYYACMPVVVEVVGQEENMELLKCCDILLLLHAFLSTSLPLWRMEQAPCVCPNSNTCTFTHTAASLYFLHNFLFLININLSK